MAVRALAICGVAIAIAGALAADFEHNITLTRLAFGSCNKHDLPQPVWDIVIEKKPQVWAWLGDIVYTDRMIMPLVWEPNELSTVKSIWDQQKAHPKYQQFLHSGVSVVGVWDDHDYGHNNAGGEFIQKGVMQPILLDFLDESADSIRRSREGVYVSYAYGHGETRVLLILLDVRYHRSKTPRFIEKGGKTIPHGFDDDMLGAVQWAWLEEQLKDPAPVKLVGSGIQVVADTPVVESWAAYPQSRARMMRIIHETKARGVVFLSGDVHFAEMSCCLEDICQQAGYPVYEFTSSGMTHVVCDAGMAHMCLDVVSKAAEKCPVRVPPWMCQEMLKWVTRGYQRIGHIVGDLNFGLIDFDWNARTLHMQVIKHDRTVPLEHVVRLAQLGAGSLGKPDAHNNCPLDDMHYRDAWRWHVTIMVFVVLTLVIPVTVAYAVARCLRALFCPNFTFDDATPAEPVREARPKQD